MQLAHNTSESKSKLISIKMPEDLLQLFKAKCVSKNLTYQTQIKATDPSSEQVSDISQL